MEINSYKGATGLFDQHNHNEIVDFTGKVRKGKVRIQLMDHMPEIEQYRHQWDRLIHKANGSVFQTFAWQGSWWKKFGGKNKLFILAFWDGDHLIGVAPFYIDRQKFFGVKLFKVLKFIGSDIPNEQGRGAFIDYSVSDFLDIIVDPGYDDEVAALLLHFLANSTKYFDRICLQETSEVSWVQRVLVPRMKQIRWEVEVQQSDVCPVLYLNTDKGGDAFEQFMQERKRRIRTQIRQLNRIMEEQKYFKVCRIQTEDELEYYFPQLVELHQKRWNDLGYPGSFSEGRYTEFLLDVFRKLLRENKLWFVVVESETKPIAFSTNMVQGKKVYEIMKAFDHSSSLTKYRPGNVAQFYMISEALKADFNEVHLLRGNERYKYALTDHDLKNYIVKTNIPKTDVKLKKWTLRISDHLKPVKFKLVREFAVIGVHMKNFGLLRFPKHYISNLNGRIKNHF